MISLVRLSAFAEDHGLVEDPVQAGPVDECENDSPIGVEDRRYATARCRPEAAADNRMRLVTSKPLAKSEAEGKDG